jgi:hypothetical protein
MSTPRPRWRRSHKGNAYLFYEGKFTTVFKNSDGEWMMCHNGVFLPDRYKTEREAMMEARDFLAAW